MTDWNKYHEKTKGNPPREQMLEGLTHVTNMKEALDLGAGSLRDTYYLSSKFNHVTALDAESSLSEKEVPTNVSVVISPFEEMDLPENNYDFVSSQFSLSFVDRENIYEIMEKVKLSLKRDGVFCGQFFGEKDEWNKGGKKMSFVTREEAEELLSGLEVISIKEEQVDKKTAAGKEKHWHLIHFAVRR